MRTGNRRKKYLSPLFTRVLESNSHKIWITVTGLEFHTVTENGELEWRTFEETEEILARIPAHDILLTSQKLTSPSLETFLIWMDQFIQPNTKTKRKH